MKVIEKISKIIGKFMALIVLAVAALALFVPRSSLWIDTSWINYLLMIVMFGMGLTMKPKDFTLIFKRLCWPVRAGFPLLRILPGTCVHRHRQRM